MKHSILMQFLRFMVFRAPGGIRCYFVHSWKHWIQIIDVNSSNWKYKCDKCQRGWHDTSPVCYY